MTERSIRNIAIIAHVDHGKTTFVDAFFRQGGVVAAHQSMGERAMDRNDLERERGVTILAKCTGVYWGDTKINIIDTPGHADFGGEVERILSMVDGVLLLVDAAEGVMPQTKFVVLKALQAKLPMILIINKIDRSDARPEDVHLEVLELLSSLGASEEQMNAPLFYAVGREGWAKRELTDPEVDLSPIFETIVSYFPNAAGSPEGRFQMLSTLIDVDPHLGKLLIGRVESGSLSVNTTIQSWDPDAGVIEQARITKLFSFRGMNRISEETVSTGDIVAIGGFSKSSVGNTLCGLGAETPVLKRITVDPPTLSITVGPNTSPLAGKTGNQLTSRHIRDRLFKEAESNVALQVRESADKESFEVFGRGELQLGVLLETMRREGFELMIGCPRVVMKKDESGKLLEPFEEVQVDVDSEYSGIVIEKLGYRRAELKDMIQSQGGRTRLIFVAPSRGLIGYQQVLLTDSRGTGIVSRSFSHYGPHQGAIETGKKNGYLISMESGTISAYALRDLEERGVMFVKPGDITYPNMIIGWHNRENDLEVNPTKTKQLSNMRAAGKDDAIRLTPPHTLVLEDVLAWFTEDSLLEITPKELRLCMKLDAHERKRAQSKSS